MSDQENAPVPAADESSDNLITDKGESSAEIPVKMEFDISEEKLQSSSGMNEETEDNLPGEARDQSFQTGEQKEEGNGTVESSKQKQDTEQSEDKIIEQGEIQSEAAEIENEAVKSEENMDSISKVPEEPKQETAPEPKNEDTANNPGSMERERDLGQDRSSKGDEESRNMEQESVEKGNKEEKQSSQKSEFTNSSDLKESEAVKSFEIESQKETKTEEGEKLAIENNQTGEDKTNTSENKDWKLKEKEEKKAKKAAERKKQEDEEKRDETKEEMENRSRIEQLAEPKKLHPDHVPNRECVPWPEKPVENTEPSSRIKVLAQHKTEHPDYKPDRPSVYWMDKDPNKQIAEASERVIQLAQPPDRKDKDVRDPEWKVPESAKIHEASERILALSQPKDFVKEYQMPSQSNCLVSESAKQAKATQRVCELAQPRRLYEKDYEPEWGSVDSGALKAVASQRVEQLAQPKPLPADYVIVRSALWTPPDSALKATATLRTEQLAKAKKKDTLCQKETCAASLPQSFYMTPRPL